MTNLNQDEIDTLIEPIPNFNDIQGLILRGYNFPYIRYIVFKINDREGAQYFCKKLLPGSNGLLNVTTAASWKPGYKPDYCLNIGFTAQGLKILIDKDQQKPVNFNKVSGDSFEFFNSFKPGAVKRADILGDIGNSAPELWWQRSEGWLNREVPPLADGSDLHIQISIFAHNSQSLESYYQNLLTMIPTGTHGPAVTAVFFKDSEPLPKGDDYIHFGYKDSFSQPRLNTVPWNIKDERLLSGKGGIDDRKIVPTDQFVINIKKYPKEGSPTIFAPHPLLENGSFAAFRLLYQDVKAFNKFINKVPEGGKPEDANPELVAAKMCGRWFDGTPLVVSPHKPNPNLKDFDFTNFNYIEATPNQKGDGDNDDLGRLCPYAAHIRRTNPRDDTKVVGNKDDEGKPNYAKGRRIMRRAGPYGPDYVENEPEGVQRGLVGLFICANLTDQFVFIMKMWINRGGFRPGYDSPNASGVDPLFGPAKETDSTDFYFLPEDETDKNYQKMTGLERFIRTDGSLFLFLPGIKALEDISNGIIPTTPQS